jgi:hypothetical protein
MDVRSAEERELDQLARLWYDAWQDAHAQIVPAELTRLRTLESFQAAPRSGLFRSPRRRSHWCAGRTVRHQGRRALPTVRVGPITRCGRSRRADCRCGGSTLRAWRRDRLARVSDRQRSGREILRKVRMAPGRRRRQPARNADWHLSAGSVAPRKIAAPRYFSTPNVNTVRDANVSPGRSTVDGNAGWFGASGKCWVSRQKPKRFRYARPCLPVMLPSRKLAE